MLPRGIAPLAARWLPRATEPAHKLGTVASKLTHGVGGVCGVQVTVDGVSGTLSHFFVEPMTPHADAQEHYASLYSDRTSDVIMFHHEGGVDVGDVDAKVRTGGIGRSQHTTAEAHPPHTDTAAGVEA